MALVRPVLNVYGGDTLVLEASVSDFYADSGATCIDSTDGDISDDVDVSGLTYPNYAVEGVYKLKYVCTNSHGESSDTETRTVVVKDTTCPACVVHDGPSSVEASFPYIDAGASCSDTFDGALPTEVVDGVNVERTGTYTVTYSAQDMAGNWNHGESSVAGVSCVGGQTYVRTVVVVDTLKPVLALSSDNLLLQTSGAEDSSSVDATITENPAKLHTFASSAARRLDEEVGVAPTGQWTTAASGFGLSGVMLLAIAAIKQFRSKSRTIDMV
jgi:hypothetical protein